MLYLWEVTVTADPESRCPTCSLDSPSDQLVGEYFISFRGRLETLEQLFGRDIISLPEMQKRLWNFARTNNLLVWYDDAHRPNQ